MQTTTMVVRGDIPMSLTDNELPPILNGIVETIKQNKEMELEDFKKMLYGLRITEDDITKIEKWLTQKGIIQRIVSGKPNKQRRDIIVFALLRIEEK
jgi:hypothetical protein